MQAGVKMTAIKSASDKILALEKTLTAEEKSVWASSLMGASIVAALAAGYSIVAVKEATSELIDSFFPQATQKGAN